MARQLGGGISIVSASARRQIRRSLQPRRARRPRGHRRSMFNTSWLPAGSDCRPLLGLRAAVPVRLGLAVFFLSTWRSSARARAQHLARALCGDIDVARALCFTLFSAVLFCFWNCLLTRAGRVHEPAFGCQGKVQYARGRRRVGFWQLSSPLLQLVDY